MFEFCLSEQLGGGVTRLGTGNPPQPKGRNTSNETKRNFGGEENSRIKHLLGRSASAGSVGVAAHQPSHQPFVNGGRIFCLFYTAAEYIFADPKDFFVGRVNKF